MDLSSEIQNFETRNKEEQDSLASSVTSILDVSRFELDNEETWLYETHKESSKPEVYDLKEWLHSGVESLTFETLEASVNEEIPDVPSSQNKTHKYIDTRTFTRPKKKYTRPTIDQIYNNENSDINEMSSSNEGLKKSTDSGVFSNEIIHESSEASTPQKPLNFDLTQPMCSSYFDKILSRSGELDTFQNMSPPSLVNSLCSSTFANLMESSFIKNDPILREIRDKDYTDSVLLEDIEQPSYQSLTESCSSINSDSPESFLKRVSRNETFRKSFQKSIESRLQQSLGEGNLTYNTIKIEDSEESGETLKCNNSGDGDHLANRNEYTNSKFIETVKEKSRNSPNLNMNGTFRRSLNRPKELDNLNATFNVSNLEAHSSKDEDIHKSTEKIIDAKINQSFGNTNTYKKSPKLHGTFRKSDIRNNTIIISSPSFDQSKQSDIRASNQSLHGSNENCTENNIDDCKLNSGVNLEKNDVNRLSYCLEGKLNLNSTYSEKSSERTPYLKRSPLGSADSLDRMSSASGSSKGSNRFVNLDMAEVDAIVEMQERSLDQVMSTPKPNATAKRLWDNQFISPITHESDSESADDYKSVKSGASSKTSDDDFLKQPKSLGFLDADTEVKLKTTQRSTYTIPSQNPLQALPKNNKGSYSNLRPKSAIYGSQSNLAKPTTQVKPPLQTNLKLMAPRLKGSYTSLRPISTNLPIAPPIESKMNVTQVIDSHSKVMEVHPIPRGKTTATAGDTFIKPQVPKASGLPRPTGIPRPSSRIPAPRSSNLRPVSSRSTKPNI